MLENKTCLRCGKPICESNKYFCTDCYNEASERIKNKTLNNSWEEILWIAFIGEILGYNSKKERCLVWGSCNDCPVENGCDKLNQYAKERNKTTIKEFLFKVESFYAYKDKDESKTIFEFLEDLKEIAKENGVNFK